MALSKSIESLVSVNAREFAAGIALLRAEDGEIRILRTARALETKLAQHRGRESADDIIDAVDLFRWTAAAEFYRIRLNALGEEGLA